MTALDSLRQILVETHVGWVPPQVMESFDDDDKLIRRQEILGPHRFTILIRHPKSGHYCGYVYVNLQIATEVFIAGLNWGAELRATYCGPGTREISWRWFNSQRKLVTQSRVGTEDDQDYWVGVAFPSTLSVGEAIIRLAEFESNVNLFRAASK